MYELNQPWCGTDERRQVWICTCGEERVWGHGQPDPDEGSSRISTRWLVCQKEHVHTEHRYVKMSMGWIGRVNPLGPGWAVLTGNNGDPS